MAVIMPEGAIAHGPPPADKPLQCRSSVWLPGEASARRYARLSGLQRYDLATAVVMLFPRGTPPAEVERVARATELLGASGTPVPALHDRDARAGWILQEDLGDVTLAAALPDAAHEDVARWYADALSLLLPIARLGRLPTSPQPPLDAVRLRRELELFAAAALRLDEPPGKWLEADLRALVDACAALPLVLCHRDYHARNLMLHAGRLRVIDHQDALPGPEPYDRVSLAYDPYVGLPDAQRDALAGEAPGTAAVAVQRLCKAIGTYADKGGKWLPSITPAARQARRLLARDGLRLPVLDACLAALVLARA
jgi:aminoglycoside/choline kinase family phosphotransferase